MKQTKRICKKIIVMTMIFITLVFFVIRPAAEAAKLPKQGEFYYSGTTQGTYIASGGNIFSWLLNALKAIVNFLISAIAMLFRMVIVGWTALLEIVLTKTLEASMGVEMNFEDTDATDVSANTNSTNNVTVEAIVYNMVPFFDINLFKNEREIRSGTGKETCDYCKKTFEECTCSEDDCECSLCILRRHYEANPDEKGVVDLVRENVQAWYYILRLIAIAAMLIVLIGIGIKMALSTIASDRAVYKRMLVDWVVGFIILFTMHYIMYITITINESLVNIIKDAANSPNNEITEITKKEFGVEEKDNEDLEISIYEAVRTRAYDAKLINGTTGMVLYATLVVFAFRFSLLYLKRYLTIIALTLMAPGVGFAYAIQKALSGKSKVYSEWLREYIMNVIIQTVHALMYSAFVTMALVLSLNNVAGMIIAFVVMNYMLKAEALFRKIFKMSSSGGLLEDTMKAGEAGKVNAAVKTAASIYASAKPITQALKNAPLTKIATGTLKTIRNEAVLAISRGKDFVDNSDSKVAEVIRDGRDFVSDKVQDVGDTLAGLSNNGRTLLGKAIGRYAKRKGWDSSSDEEIKKDGAPTEEEESLALKYALGLSQKYGKTNDAGEKAEIAEAWQAYHDIQGKRARADRLDGNTTLGAITGHMDKLFDANNYYSISVDENGKRKRTRIKGGWVWNSQTQMPEYHGVGDMVSKQLSAEQLLGMTENDKKLLKNAANYAKKGFVGLASLGIGLGTFVTDPKIGLPLLATGISTSTDFLGTNPRKSATPKEYTFKRFGPGSVETMVRNLEKSVKEDEEILARDGTVLEEPDIDRIKQAKDRLKDIDETSIMSVYNNITAERPGFFREKVGDRFFGGVMNQIDAARSEELSEIKKKEKDNKKLATILVSDALQEEYMSKMQELEETAGSKDIEEVESVTIGDVTINVTEQVKGQEKIIEHSILEVAASKGKLNISEMNMDENSKDEIKRVIEERLIASGELKKGEKIEDKIKDIDTRILSMKAKLDSEDKKRTPETESERKDSPEVGEENPDDGTREVKPEPTEQPKVKLSKVESVILEQTIQEYIRKEGIKDTKDIDSKKLLADYKKRLTELSVTKKTTDRPENQVKAVVSAIQQTKKVDAVKSILEEAARDKTKKEEITIPGTTDTPETTKTKKVYGEDRKISEVREKSGVGGSLTDRESTKVIELLLLQKKMKKVNEQAIKLKIAPVADTAYERVQKKKALNFDEKAYITQKKKKSDSVYGPVTNIIDMIKNT